MTAYELADFHPEDGHLHTCNRVGPCGCAAQLYCIAHDAEMVAEYGWAAGPAAASDASTPSDRASSTGTKGSSMASEPKLSTATKVHSLPHPPPGEYGECVCECFVCVDPDTGKCRCYGCCELQPVKP